MSSSQYHSQDEEGNYAFGYNNVNGARQEVFSISHQRRTANHPDQSGGELSDRGDGLLHGGSRKHRPLCCRPVGIQARLDSQGNLKKANKQITSFSAGVTSVPMFVVRYLFKYTCIYVEKLSEKNP